MLRLQIDIRLGRMHILVWSYLLSPEIAVFLTSFLLEFLHAVGILMRIFNTTFHHNQSVQYLNICV